MADYKPTLARQYGLTTGKWINFSFIGIPQGAIDVGSIVVEPDRLRAQKESQRLYRFLYAYDLTHAKSTPPAYIRTILRKEIQVNGNGIEIWTSLDVSPPARRVVGSCLAQV